MYCMQCGARKKKELTGRFDPQTGKKQYRMICSKEPCKHSGHDWMDLEYYGNFFYQLFCILFKPDQQCRRCGVTGQSE